MIEINHEITINASPEKVYHAMTNWEPLRKWHSVHANGEIKLGGILVFKGHDKPTFSWKITTLNPNEKISWECVEGPGDSIGTKARFILSKNKEGKTLLEFSHSGWPNQEKNYRKCNTLWGLLLYHLKNYVETGKENPLFS